MNYSFSGYLLKLLELLARKIKQLSSVGLVICYLLGLPGRQIIPVPKKEKYMKIKLGVLFGGKSVEHEISVISALQAISNLDRDKYDIYPIYITKSNDFYYSRYLEDIGEYKNIASLLKKSIPVYFATDNNETYLYPKTKKFIGGSKPVTRIDVAFPIVHGTNVEDGGLQGFLKTLNLPFVGCDVTSSAVCMDKYVMKILLKEAGIPVLDCIHLTRKDYADIDSILDLAENRFGFPVIVKPVNLGSSIGISKARDNEQLIDSLDLAFSFADRVIVEPVVPNLREINCSVMGDYQEAIPSECEEPLAQDEILSYSDKYLSGGGGKKSGGSGNSKGGMASLQRKIPADLSPEIKISIEDVAVKAFQTLNCNGVSRIDFLMNSQTNEFWLNEINTIPGSLSFYLWEPKGLKYKDLLERLISLALKRKREEEQITYSFDTNVLASDFNFSNGKNGKGKLHQYK